MFSRPLLAVGVALALLEGCVEATRNRAWLDASSFERTGHHLGARPISAAGSLPADVALEDGLGADEAVGIAFSRSPALEMELTRLDMALADLDEASRLPNPRLSLLAPLDPRQLAVILAWPIDFLWQRPHRNEAATRELEAVAESLVQAVLDLERSIRVAFADAVAARARGALLEEIAASWSSAAALSEGRWRAGDLSEAEASAAAAEATIATDAVERGRRDAEIADARLLAALAAPWPVLPPLRPSAAEVKELPARDVLLERAVDFRPDLRAAALSVHAAAARARWERSRAFTLIATLDGQAARGGWTPRFSPGAQLDVPVFSQNDGGVGRADASVVRAGYAYSAQRLAIVSEVIAASAAYDRARSSRDAYARAVDALGKAARAARSAFQTGDQSYLFVVEALRREAEAKLRAVDLDADLARAEADVWRAVGGRPRAGA